METKYRVHDHAQNDDPSEDRMDHDSHAEPEKLLQPSAKFDSIVVWGHDEPPRPNEHPLFRTTHSWIRLAKAVSLLEQTSS